MKKSTLKKMMTGVVVCGTMLTLAACGNSGSQADSKGSGTGDAAKKEEIVETDKLVVWTSANQVKASSEQWGADNNKDVQVVLTPTADFQTKLKQGVSDPKTAPDVFVVTKDSVKEWVDKPGVSLNISEVFADEAADYKKNAYKELVELGTDSKGNLRGFTAEYPVGMMFFNREVSEKVLGTQDLTEVAKAMSSEKKWIEVNDKLQKEYGGKVKLFGTMQNVNNMLFAQRQKPFVENDTFTITQDIADWFDTAKVIHDNKMYLEKGEGDAYFAGFNNDNFFIDFLPSWGFNSKIRPQITDKEGSGNWGMTSPTYAYNRGGSYFFITEQAANKKNAWEYIKSQTVNQDTLIEDQFTKLGYPSSKTAAQALVDKNYVEPLLGNQDVFGEYQKQATIQEKEYKDIVTKYDVNLVKFLGDLLDAYGSGSVSRKDALKELGDQMTSAYPELTVKEDYK
ncbi:hypothetical protein ACWOFR_01035 [Carnobacterium gallinarum]|uniref:hypothetical protein n=1 Tax=Carnobacterium gallinarum TaxID=2749 RepID=UPI00054F2438|nr:hypothetical protein [Carnobacterium gallinarum]